MADVALGPGLTVLAGPNGAGKTAFLESVYLLSRGRSFRGRRFGSLVQHGERCARVEGWMDDEGVTERLVWESRASGDGAESGAKGDGPGVGLSHRLQVRLVSEATHTLVEGEPSIRRRFVDWNVFHVEPGFGALRARYRRVGAQRNAWLRAGGKGHPVWDRPYAQVLAELAAARAGFVRSMATAVEALTAEIGWYEELGLEWRTAVGDADETLERLRGARDADVQRGFSGVGPSRDDLRVNLGGRRWVGSRGETKIVGVLLQLAAQAVVQSVTGRHAVWLVDDLSAELGDDASARLADILTQRADQVILTALPGRQPLRWRAMFHVEQGAVQPSPRPLRAVAG